MLSSKWGARSQNQKVALGPWWQLKVGTGVFLKRYLNLPVINHRWAITMDQRTAELKEKIHLMDWKCSTEASVPGCHCWKALKVHGSVPWYTYIYTHLCTRPLIRGPAAMVSSKVSWWHHSRMALRTVKQTRRENKLQSFSSESWCAQASAITLHMVTTCSNNLCDRHHKQPVPALHHPPPLLPSKCLVWTFLAVLWDAPCFTLYWYRQPISFPFRRHFLKVIPSCLLSPQALRHNTFPSPSPQSLLTVMFSGIWYFSLLFSILSPEGLHPSLNTILRDQTRLQQSLGQLRVKWEVHP